MLVPKLPSIKLSPLAITTPRNPIGELSWRNNDRARQTFPWCQGLDGVSNGGDNTRYGFPAMGFQSGKVLMTCQNYKLFQNNCSYPNGILGWSRRYCLQIPDTVYLGETTDNILQLAHVDMKDIVTKDEEEIWVKSCIGFTPINEDGMMLQVWTKGKSMKYHTVEEVVEAEKGTNHDNEPKQTQSVMSCIFYMMLCLCFLEIIFMLEVLVLAAKCHVQAKFLKKKFYCRMAIFISIYAATNWHMIIAMEKPLLLSHIMSLLTW